MFYLLFSILFFIPNYKSISIVFLAQRGALQCPLLQRFRNKLLAKDIDTIWIDAVPGCLAALVARDSHLEGVLASW
jgi:hypothetical protein